MQYRNLGRSGLKVSTLCLGTMTFGEAVEGQMMHGIGSDEATAHAILERALELGVNFVDTADVYGQDGLSERVLGSWFARTGRRDEVVLATKFRFRMAPGPLGTGASRRRIVQACEASLKRLRTDRIDLYQIHMQDIETPEEETLRALDDLVRAGKVLYLGASNYAAYRLVASLFIAEREHLTRFVSLQPEYSLVTRAIEREHVPACDRFGLGIIPWSPLAGGFLSGKYRRDEEPPAGTRLGKWKERLQGPEAERWWKVLGAVNQVADAMHVPPSQVALAWVLGRRAVTSAIFGARSLAQLEDNAAAAELRLAPEHVAALDAASEVPMGYPYEFLARVQGTW
jgi:aryl-alcohol dehydrogenase-like predicted oxidoreductase